MNKVTMASIAAMVFGAVGAFSLESHRYGTSSLAFSMVVVLSAIMIVLEIRRKDDNAN